MQAMNRQGARLSTASLLVALLCSGCVPYYYRDGDGRRQEVYGHDRIYQEGHHQQQNQQRPSYNFV